MLVQRSCLLVGYGVRVWYHRLNISRTFCMCGSLICRAPHLAYDCTARMTDRNIADLRTVVAEAVSRGLPTPALTAALQYFDSMCRSRGTAHIIQVGSCRHQSQAPVWHSDIMICASERAWRDLLYSLVTVSTHMQPGVWTDHLRRTFCCAFS